MDRKKRNERNRGQDKVIGGGDGNIARNSLRVTRGNNLLGHKRKQPARKGSMNLALGVIDRCGQRVENCT